MGGFHCMAEITGLKDLFPPFIAAVISDSELVLLFVFHPRHKAAFRYGSMFLGIQESLNVQQRSFTLRGRSSSNSPWSSKAG